jgi:hypothetical protein
MASSYRRAIPMPTMRDRYGQPIRKVVDQIFLDDCAVYEDRPRGPTCRDTQRVIIAQKASLQRLQL